MPKNLDGLKGTNNLLNEQIFDCYAGTLPYVIEKASVYIRLRGSTLLNEMGAGITLEQFITLDAISSSDALCQRDLAKILLKDRSNVTRILNILENKGFITRVTSNKGNRVVKSPTLTEKGKHFMGLYAQRMKDDLTSFLDQFDKNDLQVMEKTLRAISEKIGENASIQI